MLLCSDRVAQRKRGERKTLVLASLSEGETQPTTRVWLNVKAEEEGVNFSAVLQEALKAKLGDKA